ncbi:ParA family protein [Paraglaciecola polaris]|uniref:Chromosome partitioning protein parA n=1 Tax=Paraglaciecola polaris LMG 21857 TaxID=1129793 RepID=K6YNS3_9ALTE|nr:ParA family protein [Paraglaciecola polaris]GAC34349.1 chromosome partitioning protein parA [Paraglaciecola polaris LMG 21857]
MKVWTVANQKGGVGKTTTTVTLGGLLAERGAKVILVDTDPHASMSYYFGIDSDDLSHSLYDVFVDDKPLDKEAVLDCLCSTKLDSLFILPASMALATLDRKLGNQSGMGLILKKALALIDDEFEYALIDCPPVLGVLMVNALAASTRVVIPVQTEFLALKGLERMLDSLQIMQQSLRKEFCYTIVPTMFDKRVKAAIGAYHTLRETHGDKVWQGLIPIDTKFRDASANHALPSIHAPKARGVLAYTSLLRHLRLLEVAK